MTRLDAVGSHPAGTELIECLELPIVVINGERSIMSFNPAAAALLSLSQSDVGKPLLGVPMLAHVKNLEPVCEYVVAEGTSSPHLEMRDGAGSWYFLRICPYKSDNGSISGAILTFTNVTAFRASLDRLVAEREYTKAVINTVIDPLVVVDGDLRVQAANQAFYEMFQASRETTQGVPLFELGERDWNVVPLRGLLIESSPTGEAKAVELDHEFPGIGRRTILLKARRLTLRGEPQHTTLIAIQDITERKRAEEALRESEERFRTLADNISQFAWMADGSGSIIWLNQRWFSYTGTTLEEMQGWGWRKVHHPDHVDRVVSRIQHSCNTGEPWVDTFPLRGKDGDYRWFLTHSVPIVSEEGKIVRWFGTHTDVTEQRSADEEHRRAEKLSAAAQLASSLAHEINNPLQSLTNLLALISYRFATDKTGRDISALAEKELSRITHITKHMLALSRDTVAPTMVKLPEVLEDGLELLAPKLMAKHIRVERRYEYQEEIEGFPGELRQLFARLIDNAVEALPPEGKIILHVSVCRDWKKADSRQIRVVIADNGTGIESQLLKEIFVPFRTTKERRGTGLGLWVAKNIITRHRGLIRLRSCDRPGRSGTCVAVLLPERSTQHSSKSSVAFVGT